MEVESDPCVGDIGIDGRKFADVDRLLMVQI